MIVYCPECDSEDVKIIQLDKPEPPKRISIDNLPEMGWQSQPAVMKYHCYRATCLRCGYAREYTDAPIWDFVGVDADELRLEGNSETVGNVLIEPTTGDTYRWGEH